MAAERATAHHRARVRGRALTYGRRRAARRVQAGRFAAHPGWRHRVPAGRVVLVDQPTALQHLEDLVDAELWRADHRETVLAVCRALVCGMDWETGLVAGVTRAHLAAAAGCSTRTVSRVLAWAARVELVVCVETGATAEFLGTDRNRAPSYVLTASRPAVVDRSGNPPVSHVGEVALGETRGPERHDQTPRPPPWPLRDQPVTSADRQAATRTLLDRVGLTGRSPSWRAHALLSGWWRDEGACVAGLLHALDHHPDRPGETRGDALRAARDPLRVLGHRIAPWRGRLGELPAALRAVDGAARRSRAPVDVRTAPVASAATRAAARASVASALSRR